MTEPPPLYRLRPETAARFDAAGWPKTAAFARFGRVCCGRPASYERDYPLLRDGAAVPEAVVLALVEYGRRHRGMPDLTPEAAAAPDPYAARERGGDRAWLDWATVLDAVRRQFSDCPEMYFADPPRDAGRAAQACMRTAGYLNARPGDRLDEEACVARGGAVMGRAGPEYAAWLLRLHGFSHRATVFTVARSADGAVPVGVSSMLPVTAAAYREIAAGRLGELEINASHLCDPSPYLFIHGMAEPDAGCRATPDEVDRGQAQCMLYQAAYFTRGLRPLRPRVVAFCGSPKYADRLVRHGYRPNGRLLRGTDKPVMLLGPPRGGRDGFSYLLLRTVLGLYRYANRDAWRAEGRHGGG